jgi:hypothetical protein
MLESEFWASPLLWMGVIVMVLPLFLSKYLGKRARIPAKNLETTDLSRILHEAAQSMRKLSASPQAGLVRQEATQKLLQVQHAFRLADDRNRLRFEKKWYGILEEAARLGIMVTPPVESMPTR